MSARKQVIAWTVASVALGLAVRVLVVNVLGHHPQRTAVTDVVQGVIAGVVLAYFTANLLLGAKLRSLQTTVNGWRTTLACRACRKGTLLRGACARDVSALSVPEEEVYWQAFVDGAGRKLDGRRDYRLRFPPGGLPPGAAAWSLTVGDARRRMIENPLHRYSVGGRSGLVPNADGSIDVYVQHAAPAGHEPNWLPAPAGRFMLWLRVYEPGPAILAGAYEVPPLVEVPRA